MIYEVKYNNITFIKKEYMALYVFIANIKYNAR